MRMPTQPTPVPYALSTSPPPPSTHTYTHTYVMFSLCSLTHIHGTHTQVPSRAALLSLAPRLAAAQANTKATLIPLNTFYSLWKASQTVNATRAQNITFLDGERLAEPRPRGAGSRAAAVATSGAGAWRTGGEVLPNRQHHDCWRVVEQCRGAGAGCRTVLMVVNPRRQRTCRQCSTQQHHPPTTYPSPHSHSLLPSLPALPALPAPHPSAAQDAVPAVARAGRAQRAQPERQEGGGPVRQPQARRGPHKGRRLLLHP